MRSLLVLIICVFACLGCENSSSSVEEPELRVAFVSYSLGMTHNSHLNRSFSNPESAFSATMTIEIFLTEETDHTLSINMQ
jgi:hypothetical protein